MGIKPGYKQTDAGIIPEDWDFCTVDNVAYVTTGGKNTQDRIENGEFPFFVRSSTVERIGCYSFDGESVLTAGDGVGTGKVFHYINGKFEVHQRVYCITNFENNINGYYFYLYFSNYFYARIMKMTAKSSVDSVRKEMIAKMPIALPSSIEEQRSIAEALRDTEALLDALERLIAKKRDIKQAAMQQLLTGKIRLPGFSGEWKNRVLGEHVTFLRNGTNSRAELVPDGGVKYLHYGDIHGSSGPFVHSDQLPCLPHEKVKQLDRLQIGDLILADASEDVPGISKSVEITDTGRYGTVAGLHTIAARFDKTILADGFKGYLQYCSSFSNHLRRLAAGTKVYAINKGHLASMELRLPDVREQQAIASVLSDMGGEISTLEIRIQKTRALKQAMMQELLTGKTRLVKPEARHAGKTAS